jgi:hypothetical protein
MLEAMEDDYPGRRRLLDQESREKLPELGSSHDKRLEAKALVRFHSPESDLSWYAAEFDGEDLLYGLVVGPEIQLGYFSLSELEKAKGALGLDIERDLAYEPRSLRELIEFHRHERVGEGGVRNETLERISFFAAHLAQWDKRIVEIVGVGSINKEVLESDQSIELVCVFDPEPLDDSQGFFSVVNLMTRDEFEKASQLLGITNSIDLGFMMKGKYYLPDGRILAKPDEQITVWRRPDEQNTNE